MKVFVLDAHSIYRRGLTSCLASVDEIGSVAESGSVREAWQHPSLQQADVVVVDPDSLPGALEFIRQVGETTDAQVVVCSARCEESEVLACVEAGAVGYLSKDTLGPETLSASIRAAATGAGVMAPELMGCLFRGAGRSSGDGNGAQAVPLSRLSTREQEVLRLVADGHPIREVAQRLCYSERTIKNVIHDVVTKLNVRTRSQAVAQAVREGLI